MLNGSKLWSSSILEGLQKWEGKNNFQQEKYKFSPETVYQGLKNNAKKNGRSIAVVDNSNRSWSYEELLDKVDIFADYILENYDKDEALHVGTLLFTNIEFIVTYYACAKIGAVIVPFPTKYRAEEIRSLISQSNLDLMIVDEDLEHLIIDLSLSKIYVRENSSGYGLQHLVIGLRKQSKVSVNHNTPLILMFTSGTTSLSKGVILTHYNIIHASIVYERIFELTSKDKTIIAVPSYHITGLSAIISLFIHIGGTIYCHRFFDAMKILKCIDNEGITFMHGSPTVFKILYDSHEKCIDRPNLQSIRRIACGGSYTPIHHLEIFHKWLPHAQFSVVYGMTETSSPAFIFPGDSPTSIYAGASGKPIPGIEVKILNEHQREVALGSIGTIWIRGSVVTRSYYNIDSDLISKDGWLNTQDMAYANEEGMIWVVDRQKDMINRGGEKIWPRDVEESINKLPHIIESAVVGIEDNTYGEVAVAVIIQNDEGTWNQENLKKVLLESVATYKIPVHILFLDEMPRTKNQK